MKRRTQGATIDGKLVLPVTPLREPSPKGGKERQRFLYYFFSVM